MGLLTTKCRSLTDYSLAPVTTISPSRPNGVNRWRARRKPLHSHLWSKGLTCQRPIFGAEGVVVPSAGQHVVSATMTMCSNGPRKIHALAW